MRRIIVGYTVFLVSLITAYGQGSATLEGFVSYISHENIYVKFKNTDQINAGDTLFTVDATNQWLPSVVVKSKSSISCITNPIGGRSIALQSKLYKKFIVSSPIDQSPVVVPADSIALQNNEKNDVEVGPKEQKIKPNYKLNGRVSLSTNATIADGDNDRNQRTRLSFNLQTRAINNGKISTETYIVYRYKYGVDQTSSDFFNDFKVYNLAVQYHVDSTLTLTLGRKFNPYVSSMGVIDGFQINKILKQKFITGGFAGSRPDITNFTYNPSQLLYGAYFGVQSKNGQNQTTISLAEMRYKSNVDRRFGYIQHSSTLVKNLSLFGSMELDLFQNINDTISTKPRMTNLYLQMRYRVNKALQFTLSFDKRNNIIYYESSTIAVTELLNQATRQGFRLMANYSFLKNYSISASQFWRTEDGFQRTTTNTVVNFNANNLFGTDIFGSLMYNNLNTAYLSGNIYGARATKNFFKGKMSTEFNYRKVQYRFTQGETTLSQNIVGMNTSYNFANGLAFILNFESTFEPENSYHRYYLTVLKRFK